MLAQFPIDDVSRFAGRYLATVADCTVATGGWNRAFRPRSSGRGRASTGYSGLAWDEGHSGRQFRPVGGDRSRPGVAAERGDALPLRSACRIGDRSARSPGRRSTPGWARMVPRLEHLVVGQAEPPEAPPRSRLLARHGGRGGARRFPDHRSADMLTRQYGLTGCRYASAESYRIVERWWLERAGTRADKNGR